MLAILPDVVLDTLLGRLALLFMNTANDNLGVAREAARETLAAYDPATPAELHLAAEIISFSFHALEALSQASAPDLTINRMLRLRGSAVSLSREAHKAERRLHQLQTARRAGISDQLEAAPAAHSDPVQPSIVTLTTEGQITKPATAPTNRNGNPNWTQSYQRHQAAKRIAENLKRNQASITNPAAGTAVHDAALSG